MHRNASRNRRSRAWATAMAVVILLPIISLPIPLTARSFAGPLSHRLADNPVAVELVAQTGGVTNAVAVQGNYAYAGVGPRLIVLDTSDRESD